MPQNHRPIGARFHAQFDSRFSLLELMLTIGIIGVVSAIAMQSQRTGGYVRHHVSTVVSVRSLAFVSCDQ